MNAIGRTAVALYVLSMLSAGVVADPIPGPYFPGDKNYLPRRYFSATIRLLVKNEAGQPFRGASVSVEGTKLDIPKGQELMDDQLLYGRYTNKQGQCELRRRLPGTYNMFVAGDKCFNAQQTIKVLPNQMTTVTVTLHKWHRPKAAAKAEKDYPQHR